MLRYLILISLSLLHLGTSFVPTGMTDRLRRHRSRNTSIGMFFAEESSEASPKVEQTAKESASAPIELVSSDDERFINMVGSFLVDNFWLNSDHHNVGDEITPDARMGLVVEQCADLQEKYGERMGRRLLNTCVIGALKEDSKEMVGVATLKETLLCNDEILEGEKAEAIAKNTVAALGPKQRREYKNASIETIATELLSPDNKAVAVFSNLAISGSARKQGFAQALCAEAEALAQSWGYDEIWLVVESENVAARKLYEGKLGYTVAFTKENETCLRADAESGSFIEVKADSLIMVKTF